MSKLLTLQDKDYQRISILMEELDIRKQIDVVRAALSLLEKEAQRIKRIERWKKAVKAVAKNSKSVNKEFQKLTRFKSV